MLIMRNIIIVLLLLCLAAISVVGFMIEAPPVLHYTPDRLHNLGRSVLQVMRPGLMMFWIWWLLFLGVLLVFFITVARPRKRMKIEVQMGGGRVVIMDAAIKRYIRNALSEIGEVTVKKIDLREHRNLVTTDITADVRTRENLPTLERRIISRVRTALAEDLGITNLGDVHVFIRNFEVTGRPITPEPTPAKQTATPETVDRDNAAGLSAPAAVGAAAAAPLTINDEPAVEPETLEDIVAEEAEPAPASRGFFGLKRPQPAEEPPVNADAPIILPGDENDSELSSNLLDDIARQHETADDVTNEPAVTVDTDAEKKPMAPHGLPEAPLHHHADLDEPLPWGLDAEDADVKKDKDDDGSFRSF